MQRFFFDFPDLRDDTGLQFSTASQAQTAAVRALAEMAREVFPGEAERHLELTICNEDREAITVLTVTLNIQLMPGRRVD